MLTNKEIQVLKLRDKGLKQLEIAKKLKIRQPTVSNFISSAKKKLKDAIRTIETAKKLNFKLIKEEVI